MKKTFFKLYISFFKLFLKKKINNNNNLKNSFLSASCNGKKVHTSSCATLTITSKNTKKDEINKEKIKKIVANYINKPQEFFNFVKKSNTKIYINKNAEKILSFIGEKEGFIIPLSGFKAFYLNLLLDKKISFQTNDIFVFKTNSPSKCVFVYQAYKWLCYKNNINGYDNDTQEQFKHVFEYTTPDKIGTLDFNEIMNLKNAIQKDIEAINFTINLVKSRKGINIKNSKIKQASVI